MKRVDGVLFVLFVIALIGMIVATDTRIEPYAVGAYAFVLIVWIARLFVSMAMYK